MNFCKKLEVFLCCEHLFYAANTTILVVQNKSRGKLMGQGWMERGKGVMFSKASVLLRILFLHWLMDEKIKSPLPVTNVQSIQMLVKK